MREYSFSAPWRCVASISTDSVYAVSSSTCLLSISYSLPSLFVLLLSPILPPCRTRATYHYMGHKSTAGKSIGYRSRTARIHPLHGTQRNAPARGVASPSDGIPLIVTALVYARMPGSLLGNEVELEIRKRFNKPSEKSCHPAPIVPPIPRQTGTPYAPARTLQPRLF